MAAPKYTPIERALLDWIKVCAYRLQTGYYSIREAEKAIDEEVDSFLNRIEDVDARIEKAHEISRKKWNLLLQATSGHGKPIKAKSMEDWIVFYHGDEELSSMTVRGTFPGEINATKELLAYENNLSIADIRHTVERR